MPKTRKIILLQGQSPGDILTATRGTYDFCRAYPEYEIDFQSPCGELFDGNPYTTPLSRSEPGVEVYNITYDDINKSGWYGLHFAEAFRNDIERKVNNPHIFSITIKGMDVEQIVQAVVDAFKKQWSELSPDAKLDATAIDKLVATGDGWVYELDDQGRIYELRWDPAAPDILEVHYNQKLETWGEVTIPSTGLNPEIYLTDDELAWWNQVHCEFYWDGPYWLINAGMKSDNALKMYHRWQAVVDILNEGWQGKVRIVQIGSKSGSGLDHIHPPLKGAWNLVGKTSLRELMRLVYWSAGVIGPISFQFVLGSAGYYRQNGEIAKQHKPCVVVAGGKEGTRWHLYNHVRWLTKVGCLPCAETDGCWLGGNKGKCKNLVQPDDQDSPVPLCFEITDPEEIAAAVFDYYNGGRLEIPEKELWHFPEEGLDASYHDKYRAAYIKGIQINED